MAYDVRQELEEDEMCLVCLCHLSVVLQSIRLSCQLYFTFILSLLWLVVSP